MSILRNLIKNNRLYLDGGTGSLLQARGLKAGELPEGWNLSHPSDIISLHEKYFLAGSNIINTNTFGAFAFKFSNLTDIIIAAIDNANMARERVGGGFISFDLGPTGKLLKPMGDLDFDLAVEIFKKSFQIALKRKIDAVTLETFGDVYEVRAALIALKETQENLGTDLPVLVSFAFDDAGRTLTGSDPATVVSILESLGVDALGINCSLGPREMMPVIKEILRYSSKPVIVKPNAGLPQDKDGIPLYSVESKDFAEAMKEIATLGAGVLGGCCGTTDDYIKDLIKATKDLPYTPPLDKGLTTASSYNKCLFFSGRPILVGERINPTGKKRFKEALRAGDYDYIVGEALKQEKSGADALDVNVGLPEIDERFAMEEVIKRVQSVTTLPLQIDTTSPLVMERALRIYNGRALVNSINGKDEVLSSILPLVKKYGALVVALLLDEGGIPSTTEGRLSIAKKIYERAAFYGLKKSDILIDALTMAVSSDDKAGVVTLEVVKKISEMGGRTILGVSNISFGLPYREVITSNFFTLALGCGLSAGIVNVCNDKVMASYKAYCLLNGFDRNSLEYIAWAGEEEKREEEKKQVVTKEKFTPVNIKKDTKDLDPLTSAIIHGLKVQAVEATKILLDDKVPATKIIDGYIMKALGYVGECFEKKTLFLPQLLMASDATKAAFDIIKATMKEGGGGPKFVIATVKGDIHDIGKNIVKTLLENYGFSVIDLGKDVPPARIVEACKETGAKLVGLSALMTTTVGSMEETIKALRVECPGVLVCVGGAVMTQTYADKIGADFFGKDAMATVDWAKRESKGCEGSE